MIPLWTALITPFQKGQVDLDTLDHLVERQAQAHNGILALGTTGEGLSLPINWKKMILARIVDQAPWVVAGATSVVQSEMDEWVDFCNDLPLKGIMCCAPPYTKPGIEGQYAWFKRLCDRSLHPVMLYNNPGRTIVPLYGEVLERLKDHPRLWAMKDSSGTTSQILAYQAIAPQIPLFCGDDNIMAQAAPLGVQALVSVASNVWPRAMRQFVKLSIEGSAPDISTVWEPFSRASNPIPVKVLMRELGLIPSADTLAPLSISDYAEPSGLFESHRVMSTIFGEES